MVACPRCTARFTGPEDSEREWIERHVVRFHEQPKRVLRDGQSFFRSLADHLG